MIWLKEAGVLAAVSYRIKGVSNFLKSDLGLSEVLKSNRLSTKVVREKGDFAVVLAILQDGMK